MGATITQVRAARTSRIAALAAAFIAAAAALPHPAGAQDWPSRPITIIVPSPPGDGSDVTARLIGEKVQAALGQTIVVENRPGAGGVVGSQATAKAAPDGYTFIMGNAGSHGINAAVYENLPYDPAGDFVPVSLVFRAPNIFVASKKLPVRTLAELIAHAKANPGKLNYASGGNGSSAHMNGEYIKMLTGIAAAHVPYRGASPALNDIVSGQVDYMSVNLPPAMGLVKSGDITALAVTSKTRSPQLPDVPTVDEAGLKGYETVAWFGLLAPKGTPTPVIERMHREIAKACAAPDVRSKLAALGGEVVCNTPAEFAAFQASDIARWKEVAAKAAIRIQLSK